jgi:hypothetical protein
MSAPLSADEANALRALEKKIYRSFFQDGLWDIFWGLILLSFAAQSAYSSLGLPYPLDHAIIPALAVLTLELGKRYLTIPRLGKVRFGPQRRAQLQKGKTVLFILVTLALLILILAIPALSLSQPDPGMDVIVRSLMMGLVIMAALGIIAFFQGFSRLYVYAVVFGLSLPVSQIIKGQVASPWEEWLSFGIPAVAILAIGLTLLFRFLRTYSLGREGDDHGE